MNWWRRLFRGDRLDHELDRELGYHLEQQIAEKMREGMTEPEARRAARLSFGEWTKVREDCRESRGTMWVNSTWQDLRYAARRFGRDRTFAVVGVVILGLGVGANTTVFTAVDQILLRSLPYAEADQLMAIRGLSASHATEPLLSYSINHSMKELAIRMALGASTAKVASLLFRRAMLRAILGTASGLISAWWTAQWVEGLLFEVRPHDLTVFGGVAALLLLASAAMIMVPARRLKYIDPTMALRLE